MISPRITSMKNSYSIFCDESCHLENDDKSVMLFGSTWCPELEVYSISEDIRDLKNKHEARGELKWTKVSPSRINFFHAVVDYFFSKESLNFRALIVEDKEKLDHSYYNKGSHDSFYYKMYFYLIRNLIEKDNCYRIFLDIKDTRSQVKINKLKEILRNNFFDSEHALIRNIQQIRSSESEVLQISDFLLGAISYQCRGLSSSDSKLSIISHISDYVGFSLDQSTPPWEEKFNLFFFSPR